MSSAARVSNIAGIRRPPMLMINAALGLMVWITWALAFGPSYFTYLIENWQIALTMIPGSLVGGGTSEGGGAVAFPVLTKVLAVPADQARAFTYAIQSVGMVCASLAILLARVPIEKRAIIWATPPAIVGAVVTILFIAPHVPLPMVRLIFTTIAVCLGMALVLQLRQKNYRRNQQIPAWGTTEKALVVGVGFAGGVFSGVAGIGVDIALFIVLVLFFRVCEKITTPTTVILMAIISVVGFGCHVFLTGQFSGRVVGFWIAAAPIVAVGAPLGAWICTKMRPIVVRYVLLTLLAVEFVSTLLIVPISPAGAAVAGTSLVVMAALSLAMVRYTGYSRTSELDTARS